MADIIDVLNRSPDLTLFTDALRTTGLDEMLHTMGPFTVFAPNNVAFSKLPPGTLDDLMSDLPRLQSILKYHVVDGEYTAEDLEEQGALTTLQGDDIGFNATDRLNVDIASFVQQDLNADNGIIHVIETVLLPKAEAKLSW